jgi:hypothetical protein
MKKRTRRASLVAATAVVAAGALVAATSAFGDVAHRSGEPGDLDVRVAYYQNVKAALAPLLIHVRDLPSAVGPFAASDPKVPDPSLTGMGDKLADDFATARDLVGRIPAPEPAIGELYETAVVLYVEAARTLAILPSAGPDVTGTARQALRLRLIGDRVFDQSKRLLGDLRPPAARSKLPDEIRLPNPMPDFAGEGIEPTDPDANAAQLDELKAPALRLPRDSEARVTARLAALVAAESPRVPANGGAAETASGRALRLSAIGQQLWDTARRLARRDRHSLTPFPGTPVDPAVLRTGGAFNGHPPAWHPGDDPGAGLPAGLPPVDARQIFGGMG